MFGFESKVYLLSIFSDVTISRKRRSSGGGRNREEVSIARTTRMFATVVYLHVCHRAASEVAQTTTHRLHNVATLQQFSALVDALVAMQGVARLVMLSTLTAAERFAACVT